jgi:diguanylate cyclase (GGDEF)-like protein
MTHMTFPDANASADAASSDACEREDLRRVVRAVLQTSRCPVLLVDGRSRAVVDANAAAADRWGVSLRDLQNQRLPVDRLLPHPTIGELVAAQSGQDDGGAGVRWPATACDAEGRHFDASCRVWRVDLRRGPLWILALDEGPKSSLRADGLDRAVPELDPPSLRRSRDASDAGAADALTGLADRRHFERRLQQALDRASESRDWACAVLFVDLDGFKPINDRLGHLAGDRFLCEVARRLARCVRPSDLVARFGGDEFTVLLDDLAQRDDAVRVAERILQQVRRPSDDAASNVVLTASIGVAFSGDGYRTADDMLHAADLAMYEAKRLGKSRWAAASPQA